MYIQYFVCFYMPIAFWYEYNLPLYKCNGPYVHMKPPQMGGVFSRCWICWTEASQGGSFLPRDDGEQRPGWEFEELKRQLGLAAASVVYWTMLDYQYPLFTLRYVLNFDEM